MRKPESGNQKADRVAACWVLAAMVAFIAFAFAFGGCAYDRQPTRLEQELYNHGARKGMGISDAEWRQAQREIREQEAGR